MPEDTFGGTVANGGRNRVTVCLPDALVGGMTHNYSVAIEAGGFSGWALWDRRLQTYALVLRLFEGRAPGDGVFPPPFARHGNRLLEFPTVEALANQAAARTSPFAPASVLRLADLADRVERVVGGPEFVGLTDACGRRRLFLRAADGRSIELQPPMAHPAYAFRWGDRSSATYDTAVAIGRLALAPMTADELDAFALGLVTEFLTDVDDEFSLSAPALCAWFLADASLSSGLTPADRRSLIEEAPARDRGGRSRSSAPAAPARRSGLGRHT